MKRLCLFCFILGLVSQFAAAEKVFYFPHFGDGGGVATVVAITNPCVQNANVTLSVYNQNGALQQVDFTNGSFNRTTFALQARSSKTFVTNGTSSPVKSGYIEIRSDVDAVTATALFRFAGGLEAGILPVIPAKRFGLFVERAAGMETGVAIYRTTIESVDVILYNAQGLEIKRGTMPLTGRQGAKFLPEIFSGLSANFTGFLAIESRQPICVLGLRFGGSVLSTIAVEQNKPIQQVMAEKFLGMWFMAYKVGSSYVDQYSVHQAYEDSKTPGDFYAAAMNDWGDGAVCSYSPTSKRFLLLCLGSTTFDDVYDFTFTAENEVAGCYYLRYKSDGHLSSCYTLAGTRLDMNNPSTPTASSTGTRDLKLGEVEASDCRTCSQNPELVQEVNALAFGAGALLQRCQSPEVR